MITLAVVAASGGAIVVLAIAPFLCWSVSAVGFLWWRRHHVAVVGRRRSKVIERSMPPGRPLAARRGGAWIGGLSVSWPFVHLELYSTHVVLRFQSGLQPPLAVPRSSISKLRITRGLLGASLKLFDPEGAQYDVSFRGFRRAPLRRMLSQAGWIGLLDR